MPLLTLVLALVRVPVWVVVPGPGMGVLSVGAVVSLLTTGANVFAPAVWMLQLTAMGMVQTRGGGTDCFLAVRTVQLPAVGAVARQPDVGVAGHQAVEAKRLPGMGAVRLLAIGAARLPAVGVSARLPALGVAGEVAPVPFVAELAQCAGQAMQQWLLLRIPLLPQQLQLEPSPRLRTWSPVSWRPRCAWTAPWSARAQSVPTWTSIMVHLCALT